ncbi:MAG TPA: TlpA disulfide reductase family protein [Pyrinomonadaceae bacterium]|jgi:peroxiredoxin|nr:TlpA disulfide reductase family protein [Pyrinomonadaceae bacterium]
MRHLILLALLIATGTLGALGQTGLRIGSQAPQFTGSAIDGTDYDLNQMRGSVVVVTFWSTRCAICKAELPKVNRLIQGYEGKNVVFLAMTSESEDRIGNYLTANPQAAHVMPNSFGAVLQYADRDRAGNLQITFPAFFVIDQEGRIAYRDNGWDRTAPLGAAINGLLR